MKQLLIENVLLGLSSILLGLFLDYYQWILTPAIMNIFPTILVFVTIIIIACYLLYHKYNTQKYYDKDLLQTATYSLCVTLFRFTPSLMVLIYYFRQYTIIVTPQLILYCVGTLLIIRFLVYLYKQKNT